MSSINVKQTAEEIGVVPEVVEMLLDIADNTGHTITAIHGYESAIGIVEFEEPIAHNDGGETQYALVNPKEMVFPFDPRDADTLSELVAQADLR